MPERASRSAYGGKGQVVKRVMVSVTGKETWRPRSLASRVMDRPQARVPRHPMPTVEDQNSEVEGEAVDSCLPDLMTAVDNTSDGQEVRSVPCGARTARVPT